MYPNIIRAEGAGGGLSDLSSCASDEPFFVKAGDLIQQVGQPIPHIVEGLIPDNYLLLMTAKAKHGKTYFLLDAVNAIVTGGLVANHFIVNKPGPVVYLGLEDGEQEFNKRLRQRGLEPGDSRELYFRCEPFDLSSEEGVAELERRVASINPVLVVIDTAQEALGISNWNNRTEIATKLRALRNFARRVCAVILVHHNNKSAGKSSGDEIAGNTGVTASVDGWLSIYEKCVLASGDLHLKMRCEGRNGLRGEIILQMDTNDLKFSVVNGASIGDEDQAHESLQNVTANIKRYMPVVRAIVRCDGKATVKEISESGALTYKLSQTLVRDMRAAGLLEDNETRVGAKSNIVQWRLAAPLDAWLRGQPVDDEPDYDSAASMFASWDGDEDYSSEDE